MLLAGAGGHFLHHLDDEFSIAIVKTRGVAANLIQEAYLIIGQLRKVLVPVLRNTISEKLSERDIHRAGNLSQRVERWNGVSVFDAGKIAAKKPGAFLDVPL